MGLVRSLVSIGFTPAAASFTRRWCGEGNFGLGMSRSCSTSGLPGAVARMAFIVVFMAKLMRFGMLDLRNQFCEFDHVWKYFRHIVHGDFVRRIARRGDRLHCRRLPAGAGVKRGRPPA